MSTTSAERYGIMPSLDYVLHSRNDRDTLVIATGVRLEQTMQFMIAVPGDLRDRVASLRMLTSRTSSYRNPIH